MLLQAKFCSGITRIYPRLRCWFSLMGNQGPAKRFDFIEEKGGAGLWSWDIKTNTMDWSPGFYALFGLEPGKVEPSYAEINARTHPEDRRPPGQIEHVLSQALPINRTFRIIRPDGRVRWLLGRGEILVDAQGAPQRSIGIAFDVTHHHEQLKTLEISDARFQALVKSLRAAIWMAQPDGHVTASLNWTELTDEDPANFLGTAWVDTLHPDDRAAHAQDLGRCSHRQEALRGRTSCARARRQLSLVQVARDAGLQR